ncbi:MAG: non-ribosomal peptide synthetase domain protein [Pseudonocardia sp.]|nr:non-ribosomal peptide synthetase domain protein [Pseudonocardia sp.]
MTESNSAGLPGAGDRAQRSSSSPGGVAIDNGRAELVLVDSTFDQRIRSRPGDRLDRLFEEQCDWLYASGRSGQLAVDAGEVVLTYDELDGCANQLARYLLARGVRPGDRVALLFDQGPHGYAAMLAVLKVQAAYVPLDVGFPADRIGYIARDAGVRMVLSVSRLAERLPDLGALGVELVLLDHATELLGLQPDGRLSQAEHGGPVDELAYVIYTSGSTGRPKGVAVTHASICNFVRVAAEVYGITEDDRMYQGLTTAFDFSVEEIWVPWLVGATLVPKPGGSSLLGHDLHEFLSSRRVTAMCCVPTLLATLEEEDLPDLRFLLVSGEACPRDLVVRWHRPGRRFLNVYGPTEATVTATWTELRPDRPVTIGVPLPTYSTVILDPERERALRPGDVGEIGIAGIGLASGYLNRDDLTDKAFVPDFLGITNNPSGRIYRTGDLGRVTDGGEIEYLGRIDTQVKIRGYRVELTEIESVLLQVPGIAQAVVDTYRPEPGVVELVGYYSPRRGAAAPDRESVLTRLRERLPSYMVPAYLEELAVIPMTPQDKADRKRLPAPGRRTSRATQGAHVAGATATERLLAKALAKTLRVDQVSVDSHFFDELGANSLLMAHFSTRLRKEASLPRLSIREIYLNPTIRQLAAALGDVTPTTTRRTPMVARPIRRASSAGYVFCGAMQLLFLLGETLLAAWVFTRGFGWMLDAGTDPRALLRRAALFTSATFLGLTVLPILAKWLLVGAWTPREIRLWSPGYLRFWVVKSLNQMSPMVLFAGSPLFTVYLRLLGMRIGRGVTIHSRSVPVATDLITVGEGTVIRKDCSFSGYRAINGVIQIGPVTIGRGAHLGEKTVLDIHTSMGDGAELGHSSALQSGQSVPPGATWHGCPAEPTRTSYRTCPLARCGTLRKVLYSTLQLAGVLIGGTVGMAVAAGLLTYISPLKVLLTSRSTLLTSSNFYLLVVGVSLVLFLGGILTGLVFVMAVPRLLNLFITPERVYPLYGFHYVVQQAITAMTNVKFFMDLFGDSSAVVHYLHALGYKMGRIVQSGSNFGAELRQDSPYLTTIGTETMVSDALSVMNADYSGSSFRMSRVTIGERNFLGNFVAFPAQARTGDNVLFATKVLVPIDGPIRENVGLLGSPPFEIPRSVERDSQFDELKDPSVLRRRLTAKNWHNTRTAALFLMLRYIQLLIAAFVTAIALGFFLEYGQWAVLVAAVLTLVLVQATAILAERAARGFRRLNPRFCSIYDHYFWTHERLWKLLATPAFNGTPFKNLLWRLLGVRIGRRVFDDGCSIPEKTLVAIGDDAILNAGSIIQCHSLEHGTFKSDHTTVGSGATVGVHAFVHYGVTMGDGSVLDADAFLMKGEEVTAQEHWQGNPARPKPTATGARRGPHRPPDPAELFRRIALLEHRLDQLTGDRHMSPGTANGERRPAPAVGAAPRYRWRTVVSRLLALIAVLLVAEGVAIGASASSLTASVPVALQSLIHSVVPPPDVVVRPAAPPAASAGARPKPAAPGVTVPGDGEEVAFVRDFYALLPGDVPAAYALLTPEFQRQTGGLAAFSRLYRGVASVAVVGDPVAVDADTVTATVRFQRVGGVVSNERYTFTVATGPDGRMTVQSLERR